MQNEIKNIVGHKALINSGKMKIVLTERNISSAWILAGGTCERKGNFDCRVIRCHYLLIFLNAGRFQTCFTGAFDISSRVGIFAKHTRISGKIWELKRGNLIAAMQHVDEEEDINKVLKYFSYEHFYVIYCKFWELDTDHDFFINKENLIRYGNHALTYRIVDRIFSQVPRKFTSKVVGKMCYEDFVYFMLSEEDKSSEPALEYWFRCIDLDGNGLLTPNELQYLYEEQLHRMECMAQEPVLFEDVLCQIVDMIGPENQGYITLCDLKGCKLSGNVFNILFNLNKFIAFESRDPFLIRQERENPTLTEWDRFAHREYIRLSMEEDAENVSNGSGDIWDESLEAPF